MPRSCFPTNRRPSQTKIVATVGPACAGPSKLVELIQAGVDVFRINTAHGSHEEHQRHVQDIRAASRTAGQLVAILVDLAGPKIRLGELPGGQLMCEAGAHVRFIRGNSATAVGELTTNYGPLIDELKSGDTIVLADGTVALRVEEVGKNSAVCHVIQAGLLRSRQGVNLPGVKLSAPALSQRDREHAVWAARSGIDFIGLSFVRSAEDLRELKALIAFPNVDAQVVAKIEKPEALENLKDILEVTDAVMIARGDLGVEIDIARVPVIQKQIVAACHEHQKPVIVATQMLDSMQHSRIPTRAEATDVANAILDGADACMLSGETAIGNYPRESVETMHRIARETETLGRPRGHSMGPDQTENVVRPLTEATTFAAGRLAEQIGARIIVVASAGGHSARCLSTYRLLVPTLGVSNSEAILRRMCLYWGVIPLEGAPLDDNDRLVQFVVQKGRREGFLGSGDRIVLVAGTGLSAMQHNLIAVHEVEEIG